VQLILSDVLSSAAQRKHAKMPEMTLLTKLRYFATWKNATMPGLWFGSVTTV